MKLGSHFDFHKNYMCVFKNLSYCIAFFKKLFLFSPISKAGKIYLLLSARTTMWSMPVVLTETENENDSVNQNSIAKMTLQK